MESLCERAQTNWMDATGLCEKEKAAAGFPDIEDDDEVEQIIQGVDERARTPAMQAFLTAMSNRDDEDEHYDSLISLQTGLQEFQRPPCLVRKSEYDRCINSLKRIYRKLEKPLKDHRVVRKVQPLASDDVRSR